MCAYVRGTLVYVCRFFNIDITLLRSVKIRMRTIMRTINIDVHFGAEGFEISSNDLVSHVLIL